MALQSASSSYGSPLSPFGPFSPLSPLTPLGPRAPFTSFWPCRPVSPFGPGGPGGPRGPVGPGSPVGPGFPFSPRGPKYQFFLRHLPTKYTARWMATKACATNCAQLINTAAISYCQCHQSPCQHPGIDEVVSTTGTLVVLGTGTLVVVQAGTLVIRGGAGCRGAGRCDSSHTNVDSGRAKTIGCGMRDNISMSDIRIEGDNNGASRGMGFKSSNNYLRNRTV